MKHTLSRREFLKVGAAALGGMVYNPFPLPQDEGDYPSGEIGRVAHATSVSVYEEPNDQSQILFQLPHDALVNIYYETFPPSGPSWNPKWYRVWGGYVHSARVQRVKIQFNTPLATVREAGQLFEVSVPYSQIYKYSPRQGWQRLSRLYYQSLHWGVGVDEGPDKQPWYRLYDELREDEYHVPATHLRVISDEEINPISPDVPWEDKYIEVSIADQTLTAYEAGKAVLQTKISSGLAVRPAGQTPWDTPKGNFNVESKMPSKHMGSGSLAGDDDYPGVPWTSFFYETGVAFHGSYWHDNFGVRMSHGCVNMRVEEAKWLFRWTDPKFKSPVADHTGWEQRGYGTQVYVV
jgi:hypothetical protein